MGRLLQAFILCLPLLFAFQSGACHTGDANLSAPANVNRNANAAVANANVSNRNQNMQNDNAAADSHTIKAGIWGGPQIGMTVTSTGAEINYPCARGSIDGPLKLDARGNFDLTGTHTVEHPGPVRLDENDTHPARYTGNVMGDQMTLKITLTDTKEDGGTFTLTYGRGGRVRKCA